MSLRLVQLAGIVLTLAYGAGIAFLYATQPRSLAEVGTRARVAAGTYRVDESRVQAGLELFHREQHAAARDEWALADPEQRDPRVQFLVAYAFYRQGWGRMANDDALFRHTETPQPTATETPLPTPTEAPSATSTVAATSLKARVMAGFLSCRYGPGPEYLYLYALRQGANIKLIGRADGDNWHWAWVEGRNRCWVNTRYLQVEGDWRQLPIVYPGLARLPVSPYYPPSGILSIVRLGNSVTVEWIHIPLRAGDEEDESMQRYILEVWHCQGGSLLFEPLATNDTVLTVLDEPGCSSASHARLFVQEKHGFSGPTDVPWPSRRRPPSPEA